jgi:crotonobetainyl-CoA:carnitine CoA-transferase CaiB-like acyl-CoA transferase
MVQQVPGRSFSVTGLPITFDGQRPAVRFAAPRLGEHTDEVFGTDTKTQAAE